jgi:G3E family GTPase
MAVATFDTIKFANTLKAAGVPDKQAEAQAVAFAEVVHLNLKDLTTQDDLKALEASLEAKRKAVETRFEGEIKALRTETKSEMMHINVGGWRRNLDRHRHPGAARLLPLAIVILEHPASRERNDTIPLRLAAVTR